jgi:small-conductance mechanosensitive channel
MVPEVATLAERFRLDLVAFGPRVAAALAVAAAFWVAARAVGVLVRRFGGARGLDPDLVTLIGRAARIALVVVGTVTALGTLGLDVSALVAGLGLTGFALGFALRDIISNTLAGVLILLFKPFRRGDRISVAGAEGVVAEVDLRYTTLVVDEGTRVLVPNATLFTNAIRVVRPPPR